MVRVIFAVVLFYFLFASGAPSDPECARKFASLSTAQKEFETYPDHLVQSPVTELATKYEIARLQSQLFLQFKTTHNLNKLNRESLKNFTRLVEVRLENLGFKAKVNPQNPEEILIESLPNGHPLANMFLRSQRAPLLVKHVFNTRLYVQQEASGTQRDAEVYLADFVSGKLNKLTYLHEVGHRSEQVRSRTTQKSLYNIETTIDDETAAEQVMKLGPRGYRGGINSDELNQHATDLNRLYGKSGESLVENLNDGNTLANYKKGTISTTKKIAEALLSQSDFVLGYLSNPAAHVDLRTASLAVIEIKMNGQVVGNLRFDLTASKLQRPEPRLFQRKNGNALMKALLPKQYGFVEMKTVTTEFRRSLEPQSPKIYTEAEVDAIRAEEKKPQEDFDLKVKDIIRSLVQFQKAEAERVLRKIDTLEKN